MSDLEQRSEANANECSLLRPPRLSASKINHLINPLLDFLESESGRLFRQLLIHDILDDLEVLPSQFFNNIIEGICRNTGISISTQAPLSPTLDCIQRIGKLLQGNSVNPIESVPDVFQLLLKPEAQRLGQQIITQWGQKALKLSSFEQLFFKNS